MGSNTNIRHIRESRGLTLREVAQRLETSAATVSRWEREPQRVTVPVLNNLARVLDVDPAALLEQLRTPDRPAGNGELVMVRRLRVANNSGADNPFDANYISRLTGTAASSLAILTVQSDAMAPTVNIGDQALIDLTKTALDIPGVYAIKQGNLAHLRRINVILGSDHVRVTCDNPAYGDPLDVHPDKLEVCGRVIWLGKKL